MELPDLSTLAARARFAGLTVSEMCRRAGVNVTSFNRWRRGANSPSVRNLQAVIKTVEEAERAAMERRR